MHPAILASFASVKTAYHEQLDRLGKNVWAKQTGEDRSEDIIPVQTHNHSPMCRHA